MTTRSPARLELLESRRLLSLTIDLRLAVGGGGKAITVDHIGQVVDLQAWAVVKGTNASISDEGLQIVTGSFLSSNIAAGSVRGDISVDRVGPFNAPGSQDPAAADLDGDGDPDAGSNSTNGVGGYFACRSGSVTSNGAPAPGGGAQFKIADVQFTVTSLLAGGETDLNFRPRNATNDIAALWQEDGALELKTQMSSTFQAGAPVVVYSTGGGTGPTSIHGTIFNDFNQNAVHDSGESALAGVTVFLDADHDATLDPTEVSTKTNSAGEYSFTDLAASTYRVRQIIPGGFVQIAPANSAPYTITVALGENHGFADFADSTLGQIHGAVFDDANHNGVRDAGEIARQGASVYVDSNHNAVADPGEQIVTTDSTGTYALKNLAVGNYDVRAAHGSDLFLPALRNVPITRGDGIADDINFGLQLPAPVTGSITGSVTRDANANGIQDERDLRLAEWLVWLDSNNDGEIDAGEKLAVTDASGNYRFSDLPAGSYNVRVETTPALKVALPTSVKYVATISTRGQIVSGRNFFLALANLPTASISGSVYDDADADGTRDASEKPLAYWRVYLDANHNALLDPDEKTTLTNGDGVFAFTGLFPGTYRVRETLRGGYRRVTPTAGYYDLTIAAGTTRSGANFGNTLMPVSALPPGKTTLAAGFMTHSPSLMYDLALLG